MPGHFTCRGRNEVRMGIRGWIGLLLLVIHILICIWTYLGIKSGAIPVKMYVFPVVVFVPAAGFVCCLMISRQMFLHENGDWDTGTDRLKINEETYRSFLTAPEEEQKEIIPLEEVLIVNDAKVRRKLIMDILHDDPERYMDILMQARLNEDVEVVHYATTAMAELSKSYDERLQKLAQAYEKDPDNKETLDRYCIFLKQYLENGLAEGQMEITRRTQYSRLLEKKKELETDQGQMSERELCALERTYLELVKNEFAMSHDEKAEKLLQEMEPLFCNTEDYLMLKAELYARLGMGAALKKQIRKIMDSGVYLSSKNRAALEFWKGQTE